MNKIVAYLLFFFLSSGINAISQSVITFDDLPAGNFASNTPISNGYEGYDWNNFAVVNAATYPFQSGYLNGIATSPNVAYNGGGNPASFSDETPFTLISGFFTAAWNNRLSFEVIGLYGSASVYDVTSTINASAPSLLTFPSSLVTEVEFESSGGTNAGYQGAGTEFVMDNLTISAVPEPSTVLIVAAGLSALALRRK